MKAPIFDERWPAEVVELYRNDLRQYWDRSIEPHSWNQYQNQLRLYRSFVPEDRSLKVLEVGCAQGTLSLLLAEAGHRVWGSDIRPSFLEYAASRYVQGEIHFVAGNILEDATDLPSDFDLVFANQIVEHLVYPARLVECLCQRLSPGGKLVITTPNGGYVKNSLPTYSELGDPREWEHLQFTAGGDGHFFAYSPSELPPLFESAGLRDVQVSFFESPWVSGHLRFRHLHRVLPLGILTVLDKALLSLPVLGRRLAHQMLISGVKGVTEA